MLALAFNQFQMFQIEGIDFLKKMKQKPNLDLCMFKLICHIESTLTDLYGVVTLIMCSLQIKSCFVCSPCILLLYIKKRQFQLYIFIRRHFLPTKHIYLHYKDRLYSLKKCIVNTNIHIYTTLHTFIMYTKTRSKLPSPSREDFSDRV